MTWGAHDSFYPRDVCDLDPPTRREPRFEDALELPAPRQEPPRLPRSHPPVGAAPLHPYVQVVETKTRGWQVRYHTPRASSPIIVARGLSEDQARAVGEARAAVQDCPLVGP